MTQCYPCTEHNLIPVQDVNNPYQIIDICCDFFNITRKELFGLKRERNIAFARHATMFILHSDRRMMLTLREIGAIFNGRDHSTTINAIKKISNLMDVYYEIKETMTSLYKKIYGTTNYLSDIRYKY